MDELSDEDFRIIRIEEDVDGNRLVRYYGKFAMGSEVVKPDIAKLLKFGNDNGNDGICRFNQESIFRLK